MKKQQNKCGVYAITNKQTNEVYVGSSKSIEKRWYAHKYYAKKTMNANRLYADMADLGIEAFEFTVIEECPESDLRIKEQYYIDTMKPAYNTNKASVGIEVNQQIDYNEYHRLYLKTQEEYNASHKAYCSKWNKEHPEYFVEWRAKQKAKEEK